MKISSLNKVDKVEADMQGARDVYRQLPVSKQAGSPNFSFRVFALEPKDHPLFQKHPCEHLIMSSRARKPRRREWKRTWSEEIHTDPSSIL